MFAELVDEMVGLSDQELDGRLRALELRRRAVEAELSAAIAVAEARQLNAVDAHRSMKGYLRATCNWSPVEVSRFRSRARAVDRLDGVGDAWLAGRVGGAQVDELARAHGNPRVREQLAPFVPTLLRHAEQLPFDDFRLCVQRFVLLADTDGAHHDVDAAHEQRNVRLAVVDGSLHLGASGGDAVVNAELEAIFRHFVEREVAHDLAERRALHGDRAEGQPLTRVAGQRRYDALVAVFRTAYAAGDAAGHAAGGAAANDPLVNVLIDDTTWGRILLEAGLSTDRSLDGRPLDPFTGLSAPADLLDDHVDGLLADLLGHPDRLHERRCETSTGIVLHPHQVLRAALAGHLRRVVVDATGVVIDMGRRQRLFTGAAREAAKLLATRCAHPGCDLPSDFCQVDHAHEWGDLGPTDQANATVRCGGHNRAKHRRRYRSRRSGGGVTHTVRPDGTLILPVGVPPPDDPPTPPGPDDPGVVA